MSGIPDNSLKESDPFFEKIYTAQEKRQAKEASDPGNWLRRRFAAKEAVFKALRMDPEHSRINEIEILDDESGAPHVTLHGSLKKQASDKRIVLVHVSVSSDGEYALAYAVAESSDQEAF